MIISKRVAELKTQGYNYERARDVIQEEYPGKPAYFYIDVMENFNKKDTELEPTKKEKPPQIVRVVNFDMPFIDMVFVMVKWAIAAIPAIIILSIIGFIISPILAVLGLAW